MMPVHPAPPPDLPKPCRKRRPLAPGLLRAEDAATFCACSRSAWDRANASGLTPAGIRIGGVLAWGRAELAAWVRHGCPPRPTWAKLWVALRDRSARR